MPRYNLRVAVTAANITQVRKALAGYDVKAAIAKVNLSPSRADRLAEALQLITDALGDIEDLKDELEDWHDSIPENLQAGAKADEVQEAIDQLDTAYNDIDSAVDELRAVSFPGMF